MPHDEAMVPTTLPTTCTVRVSAVTGALCGKPAVATLRGRTGKVYAECAEHVGPAPMGTTVTAFAAGTKVAVRHAGVLKIGTIVRTGPVRAKVEVPIHGGTATKIITVPLAEVGF